MSDRRFTGCGTALLTPFKGEEVDYEAFAATVDWQVTTGVDFLVPLGTTGETPTLSDEEKRRVLDVAIRHAAGRPVVAGVGSNSVGATLANMVLLQDADAFLVVVPFYNKPPQRGMYAYFKAVAEATPKPVILYNVPGRTGANLEAATALALARDVPNIIGIKEASGKPDQIQALLDGRPEGFRVLSGNDSDTAATRRMRPRWTPPSSRLSRSSSWSRIPFPPRRRWPGSASWRIPSACRSSRLRRRRRRFYNKL